MRIKKSAEHRIEQGKLRISKEDRPLYFGLITSYFIRPFQDPHKILSKK